MNKFTVVIAFAMFALGAVAGRSIAPTAAVASVERVAISPMDMMRNAGDLPVQIVDNAV